MRSACAFFFFFLHDWANTIQRSCVTSVVRLAYLPRLLLSVDVSCMCQAEKPSDIPDEVSRANRSLGKVVPVAMLDIVEQSLGIITASLPALTAYVAKYVYMLQKKKSVYF